jgi:hypothetical protein
LAGHEGLDARMTRLLGHPSRDAAGGPLRWAEALVAAHALGGGEKRGAHFHLWAVCDRSAG